MTRFGDWEQRLADYLASKREAPFVWGEHDCALFVAGGIQALTGDDLAVAYRGKYSTAVGSVRALKRYGAGTLEATLDANLATTHPASARRGDVVMVDGIAGICVGSDALFVGEEGDVAGLIRIPRQPWQRAWSVG